MVSTPCEIAAQFGIKDTVNAIIFGGKKKSHLYLSSCFRSSLAMARLGFYPKSNTWFPFRRAGPPQTRVLSHTAG